MAQPYPGVRNVIREAFARQSLDNRIIDIRIQSWSEKTLRQYNTTYKLWYKFCKENNFDYFKVSVPTLLKFFSDQFQKEAKYGTLNSIRSALSLILGKEICNNDCVNRFLKGVFRMKPNLPKYHNSWDPNVVLSYLSNQFPNESLNVELMTKKLVTLLALSTGQRVQTLSLIKVNNIMINETCLNINIDDIIKTSAPNRVNPRLIIPFSQINRAFAQRKLSLLT